MIWKLFVVYDYPGDCRWFCDVLFQIVAHIFCHNQHDSSSSGKILHFFKAFTESHCFSCFSFNLLLYSQCFRNITLLQKISRNLAEANRRHKEFIIPVLNPPTLESEVNALKDDSIYRRSSNQIFKNYNIFTFKQFMGTWTESSSNFQDDFKNLLNELNSRKLVPNQLIKASRDGCWGNLFLKQITHQKWMTFNYKSWCIFPLRFIITTILGILQNLSCNNSDEEWNVEANQTKILTALAMLLERNRGYGEVLFWSK